MRCDSRPILFYGGVFFFLIIHMERWPNMYDLIVPVQLLDKTHFFSKQNHQEYSFCR